MRRLVVNIRVTFTLFVLVGSAFIFTLTNTPKHEIGVDSSATYWVMMSAVLGLMVIFGIIIWFRSKGGYATEGDAETFYYLGFIYTLLTLVATFTPLLTEGSKPSTQQVLGFFGLGLITTFFGLTGRIFFMQPRSSGSPDESATRLSKAYIDVARQLEASAMEIARTQGYLATSLEKSIQKICDDSHRLFDDANNRVTSLTTNTAEHISHTLSSTTEGVASTLDEFKKRLAALKLPPSEFGERLGKSIEGLIMAMNAATESASQFETNITAASKKLMEVGSEASMAAGGLNTLSSAAQGVSKEVEQSETALSTLRMQAESAKQSLASITLTFEKFSPVAHAALNDLNTVQKGVGAFYSAFDGLANAADKAAPALGQLGSQVTDVAAHITQLIATISATEELASKVTGTQQAASAELLRGIELLKTHQNTVENLSRILEQDLLASEDALKKVHSNLIKATDFLTTKVQ